jgi:hypothetical protein
MLRHAALVVLVAAVGSADAGGHELRQPTLGQALERAQVIAYGQVEKLEQRSGGQTIATMQVEHVARGDAPLHLTYSMDLTDGFEPHPKVGDRELVFLEPSGATDVPLKIAFGGAVLATFKMAGKPYVGESRASGIKLPLDLCDSKAQRDPYPCVASLDAVLGSARLTPFPAMKKKPATFRIAQWTCEPCELGAWMKKTSKGEKDCGSTPSRSKRSNPAACVQGALAAKKPFRVVTELQGSDRVVRLGFVSEGATAFRLSFDSNVKGGAGTCAARIDRMRCRSLEMQQSQGSEWLRCVEPEASEVLCAQLDGRVESLTPPRSVGDLRCDKDSKRDLFSNCAVRPGSSKRKKSVPSPKGPNLICQQVGGSENRLTCQPD